MKYTITIKLDEQLEKLLTQESKSSGMKKSDIAREALRIHLVVKEFEQIRKKLRPFAEKAGYLFP